MIRKLYFLYVSLGEVMIELSLPEAQKVVLLSQKVPPAKQAGTALFATQTAIEHLGYVQIDTISTVQRAHHHTFWVRNPRYELEHLDRLVADKKVFEYWAHAAAYLPMCNYRFTLPRKEAIARGEQEHWYVRDNNLINAVRERITIDGPLMAKDFTDKRSEYKGWGAKPTKQALEYLFLMGELMIPRRENFHKVYDLTERVLPSGFDTSTPTEEEYVRFLIMSYLKANGIGQVSEINYLLKNSKKIITRYAKEMVLAGELQKVEVQGVHYYALPDSLSLLKKPLARKRLSILSPFDNLIIQRKRMKEIFQFDYQLECYVPASKRKYGYFSLPILWDGKLVARMDCKAERKEGRLRVRHLAIESSVAKVDAFADALSIELQAFKKFNGCDEVLFEKVTPNQNADLFTSLIR